MNRTKSINIAVCVVAAIAIVTSSAFLVKHFSRNNLNASETTSGKIFDVIGDVNSYNEENTSIEYVTDASGEYVTKANGEPITRIVTVNNKTTQKNDSTEKTTTNDTPQTITKNVYVTSKNNGNSNSGGNKVTTTVKHDAKTDAGVMGFKWSSEEGIFYSSSDPWQRQFGYNKLYDLGANFFVMYFDTVRFKFNYGGLDWMIQCWKGQYGFVLLGAEVGVYYKPEGTSVEHYACTDNNNKLYVGYTCYNHDNVLFTRKYQSTWWLTGFVEGKLDKFADRSQMKLKVRITLKDTAMAEAFVKAVEGQGFTKGNASSDDTYYQSGKDVYFMWKSDKG